MKLNEMKHIPCEYILVLGIQLAYIFVVAMSGKR